MGLTFQMERGESMLVLGPSGSGKSTLSFCINGMIPHVVEGDFDGDVTVEGMGTREHPVREFARKIGIVFQDPEAQFCTLTVEDEVAFGLENLRVAPSEIDVRIDKALGLVGLAQLRGRHLDTLSGGQKQRVALASVLALDTQVLVLDEPTANLDPSGTREVLSLLGDLRKSEGLTVILIEHKLDHVMPWVDSVLALDGRGRLVFRGSPKEAFYEVSATLREAGVWLPRVSALTQSLKANGWPIPDRPLTLAETADALGRTPCLLHRLRDPAFSEAASELPKSDTQGSCAPAGPAVSLSVNALGFSYPGGRRALRDVTFDVRRGELLAVAGVNGAGKSTLASLLSGVRRPPANTVFLEGRDMAALKPAVISGAVGHVFQNPEHQFVTDTVRDELVYSLTPSKHARLTRQSEDLVEETLERFDLKRLERANPFSLSQGQKRRLSVAAMLVRAQSILVLDEPTFGLDQVQSDRLLAMLDALRVEGRAIVVVTHDMDLIAEHAHRLLVLRDGTVEFLGTPREFFGDPARVAETGLECPTLARLSEALAVRHDTVPGLLTTSDYLSAAGFPSAGGGVLRDTHPPIP